ncbi:Amino acid transporter transmembrane domain-containing protein [[Candida] zeylanoides]
MSSQGSGSESGVGAGPIGIQGGRRRSFLDAGGPNSVSNFASSYARTQRYWGHSLGENSLEDDSVSPGTSPVVGGETSRIDETLEYSPLQLEPRDARGLDHLESYQFPGNDRGATETASLLPRAGSFASVSTAAPFEGSTVPQTIFNSVNTMIGIGMFSLPLGFKLAGWGFGCLILLSCAVATNYTAKLLGRALRRHQELMSYSDIAQRSFGASVTVLVSLVFTADLIGATTSLVLLFGVSFAIVFPSAGANVFKAAIVAITFCSSFVPLSVLSVSSLVGVLCSCGVLAVTVYCGLVTGAAGGGSILHPAETYFWPRHYSNLLVSLGVFMAPWGGHVVFPELYRDMRHPAKYDKCANITFLFACGMDLSIGAIGFLMFGPDCRDSFAKNLMIQQNFPRWISPAICVLMAALALFKTPLLVRPVFSVLEKACGLNAKGDERFGASRVALRLAYCVFLFGISVVFTSFGAIMAFLGSAICFTICVVLPLAFYLKLFREELGAVAKASLAVAIAVGSAGAIAGTYGAITIKI